MPICFHFYNLSNDCFNLLAINFIKLFSLGLALGGGGEHFNLLKLI